MTMPRYDYRCPTCRFVYEVWHDFHDTPTFTCPDHGDTLTKLITRPNVAAGPTRSYHDGKLMDVDATRRAEAQKEADMAAYKRLRVDHRMQPPSINGSARLEAKAENRYEVESGHTFRSASARKRSMGFVKDFVDGDKT